MGSVGCEDGLRRFLHGGRDATRSQGTELATSQLRRLEMAAGD